MSALALAAILGGTFYPLYASGEAQAFLESLQDNPNPENDPRFLAIIFAIYFVSYFVMIYFNAALLACAMIRFAGSDPTLMDGLKVATRNLPQILAWAFVTALVGFILEQIEQRLKGLASFFVSLLGAGWAVATYFAVPVLVVDGVGPIEAVKRSVAAVRKTWGEALVGHIGLGALNFISFIVALPLLFVGFMQIETSPETAVIAFAIAGSWIVFCSVVITTLSAILRAALYIYAVEGQMPVNFDSTLIRNAFQPKKR
ncbi:DUF6159 family protein [Roseibium hamelinense]|nr:DUF6159 family protein [Roseibium hamelinense]